MSPFANDRWVCRDERQRVIITWPVSDPEVDPGSPSVRDAGTGELLAVDELRVTWSDKRVILAEAIMRGADTPVWLAVAAMRVDSP